MWQILNAILYVNRHGMSVAHAAGGFSALANRLWLLLALETEWTVGSHQ